MSHKVETETTINESYLFTAQAAIRQAAGVGAGDKIRWRVDEDGSLSVEFVKQQYGSFSNLKPVDTSELTNAAEDHDLLAGEYWYLSLWTRIYLVWLFSITRLMTVIAIIKITATNSNGPHLSVM